MWSPKKEKKESFKEEAKPKKDQFYFCSDWHRKPLGFGESDIGELTATSSMTN